MNNFPFREKGQLARTKGRNLRKQMGLHSAFYSKDTVALRAQKLAKLRGLQSQSLFLLLSGLYTDESPGLKVDPVVVLVLSLGFIFSVVALHSTYRGSAQDYPQNSARTSIQGDHANHANPVIAKLTRRFSS